MARSRARGAGRAGFSIFELVIVITVMGVIAASGAMQMGTQTSRIRAQAEGERLLACLRWMREMAHSRAPLWQQGYGVYFWNNPTTGTCLQYSPYSPARPQYPDDPVANAVTAVGQLGLPNLPITLGQHSPIEFQTLTPEELSHGMEIVFQTDRPGQRDYTPRSRPNMPGRVTPRRAEQTDRVVFWPPGVLPPAMAGSPWPVEYGASLPRVGRRRAVTYNRIYIRSLTDNINPVNAADLKLPVRIHIHPGTGVVRMMNKYERRDDGTW